MPMHDWTRVEPNYFHAFHVAWMASLQHALNNGTLPPGYYALAEQVTPPYEPDILALQVPSSHTGANGTNGTGVPAGPESVSEGGVALAAAPPRVRFTTAEPRSARASRRQRRVAVRHGSTHRLVAVIEIVSPGNKSSRREFQRFVDKALELLVQGVHLLVIDPFPPTARDPHGVHAAVWRGIVRKRFTPPPDKTLTLASYAAEPDQFTAFVEPLAVGDPIPDMPLFLTPGEYVNVPLGETYAQAWAGFPKPWQAVVEGR